MPSLRARWTMMCLEMMCLKTVCLVVAVAFSGSPPCFPPKAPAAASWAASADPTGAVLAHVESQS